MTTDELIRLTDRLNEMAHGLPATSIAPDNVVLLDAGLMLHAQAKRIGELKGENKRLQETGTEASLLSLLFASGGGERKCVLHVKLVAIPLRPTPSLSNKALRKSPRGAKSLPFCKCLQGTGEGGSL